MTAIAAGQYFTVALKSDGTVVGWGSNQRGQTIIPAGLSGVIAVAAGDNHTVALKNDGTVTAWGWNLYGQTSVPVGLSGTTAITAGYWFTVALVSFGPPMRAISNGSNVDLAWPVSPVTYRVESTSNLSSAPNWTNVTAVLQTNVGNISISVPLAGPQKFYRLSAP